MPTIMWSSGDLDSGETWDEVEASARAHQFRAYRPATFRDVLAKRAWLWAKVEIRTDGTAEEIFRDLQSAGIVLVLDEIDKKPGGGCARLPGSK